MSEQAGNHNVGRGKPPRGAQFKPGKSGNPKGRPKGSKNFGTLIFELANELVPAKDGTMTRAEMMLRDLIDAALDGSPKQVLSVVQMMQEMDRADEPEGLSAQKRSTMLNAAYKQMQIESEKSLAAAMVKLKEKMEANLAKEKAAKARAAKEEEIRKAGAAAEAQKATG